MSILNFYRKDGFRFTVTVRVVLRFVNIILSLTHVLLLTLFISYVSNKSLCVCVCPYVIKETL